MKIRLTNYVFNPKAKTITFPGQLALSMAGFLLISNVASNALIYNFADATQTGALAGNVLSLTYDTTAMNASDPLTIWYEDGATTNNDVATALAYANQVADEMLETMRQVRNALQLMLGVLSGTNISNTDLIG